MKHVFLNLKRFDITPERGGVNRLAAPDVWGAAVIGSIQECATKHAQECEFAAFLPEAHVVGAVGALSSDSAMGVGCQGVWGSDTAPGANFGAFTTLRTANSMAQLGVTWVLVGHCEERMSLRAVMAEAGVEGSVAEAAIGRILNREVRAAQSAGLSVLFCLGERESEVEHADKVLASQLTAGLEGADLARAVVAYEPVWSIGPGKTPADAPYIQRVACLLKEVLPGIDVVYGGGLKADNAQMLASIPEVDGGLIALTRFTGQIGFYPEEYRQIVELYLGACAKG